MTQLKKKIFRLLIFAAAVLAIAGVLFFVRKLRTGTSSDTVFYTVREEIYENTIEIAGNIAAADEQKLLAANDGIIREVLFEEGDKITKGQLILRMDDSEQEYDLANHVFQMEQKRVSGSAKELELMEMQRLILVKKIEDRQGIARFDGILASLSVDAGDYVEAKDELGILINRDYLKAEVEVAETDAGKLKTGQVVEMTFPAYESDEPIYGYVANFPAIGTITTRGATVVNAEIRLENPPEEIFTGYSFSGKIQIDAPQSVLIIEREAVMYDRGRAYANKLDSAGNVTRVDVEVEPYGDDFVKILSGLSAGDSVVSVGAVSGNPMRGEMRGDMRGDMRGEMNGGPGGGTPPSGFGGGAPPAGFGGGR